MHKLIENIGQVASEFISSVKEGYNVGYILGVEARIARQQQKLRIKRLENDMKKLALTPRECQVYDGLKEFYSKMGVL